MAIVTKKLEGSLPVSRQEFAEGATYYRNNIVTRYGSAFQCVVESTTTPPATIDASGKLKLGEGWIFFADASDARGIGNKIAEMESKIDNIVGRKENEIKVELVEYTNIPINVLPAGTLIKRLNFSIGNIYFRGADGTNNIPLKRADGYTEDRIAYSNNTKDEIYPIELTQDAYYVRSGHTQSADIIIIIDDTVKLAIISNSQSEIEAYLTDGQYGLCPVDNKSNKRGLIKKSAGEVSYEISSLAELRKLKYKYCGITMYFNEDGELINESLAALQNRPFVQIDLPNVMTDFSEESWNFAKTGERYTIMEQCYAYMDALCKKFPSVVEKYDPMATADYEEEGMNIKAWPKIKTYMGRFGFSDYPIYAKGIAAGTYTIGNYSDVKIKETPAYKTLVYKVSNPTLKRLYGGALAKKRAVYIHGGAHAPEFGASVAVCHLAKELLDGSLLSTMLLTYYDFYLVPVLDGYSTIHGIYANALGVNINRNFPTATWRAKGNDWGKAAGDQFATRIACGIIDAIKPSVAIDTHCLTTNLTFGTARTPFSTTSIANNAARASVISVLAREYPQYFGSKQAYPTVELSADFASDATARSYFFNKHIECSALVEVISRVNFKAEADGSLTAAVRDDTLYNKDTINISAYMLKCYVVNMCQYNINNL